MRALLAAHVVSFIETLIFNIVCAEESDGGPRRRARIVENESAADLLLAGSSTGAADVFP